MATVSQNQAAIQAQSIPQSKMMACRFEYKYIVSEARARRIYEFVRGFLETDQYTQQGFTSGYPVHSLYLDSPDLHTCYATMNGFKNRFKLRVFPIEARSEKRVILRYAAPLAPTLGGYEYVYATAAPAMQTQLDHFQLRFDGATIVDVRSTQEFATGHAKGAMNVPLDRLGAQADKLKRKQPLVLCCASGMRSASGAALLRSKGLEQVHNADGSFGALLPLTPGENRIEVIARSTDGSERRIVVVRHVGEGSLSARQETDRARLLAAARARRKDGTPRAGDVDVRVEPNSP